MGLKRCPNCPGDYVQSMKKIDATRSARCYNKSMKSCIQRSTVTNLINDRLAALGASNLPDHAKVIIEDQVWVAVAALIHRRVSAPTVCRALARALAASADIGQGLKGGTPLTSSAVAQNAQRGVAGHTTDTTTVQSEDTTTGGNELTQKSI